MKKYQFTVNDRMTGDVVARTRYYPAWEIAQQAAEKLCRRKFGDSDRYVLSEVTK